MMIKRLEEKLKERPILFNGAMVRAILEGRKTQTRRVIKPQPTDFIGKQSAPRNSVKHPSEYFDAYNGGPHWCWWTTDNRQGPDWIKCPYGVSGDRLWVREHWGYNGCHTGGIPEINGAYVSYHADNKRVEIPFSDFRTMMEQTPNQNFKEPKNYESLSEWEQSDIHENFLTKWWQRKKSIPSIHMPRWASRILLEVTEVRVERVQEITEEGAIAEGVEREYMEPDPDNFHPPGSYGYISGLHPFPEGKLHVGVKEAFEELWDSINEKRGFGWEKNPFVWVVTFKRVEE